MPTWIYIPSAAAAWVPTDLADLRCWLDASDSTTLFDANTGGSLPSNNGSVGRWEDKEGSNDANDAVNSSNTKITTARPTRVTSAQNSLDAINFNGSQRFDHNDARGMLRNRSCAIMAVAMKFGSVSNSAFQFAWTNRGTGDECRFQLLHYNNNRFAISSVRLDADSLVTTTGGSGSAYYNTNWHVHVALLDWTNGTFYYRVDGTQINSQSYATSGNTSDTDLSTAATARTTIGGMSREPSNSLPLSSGSRIGEMLCWAKASGSYVTAEVEEVEGYLAWKWGLEGNLPAGHPYENAAP